MKCFEGHRSNDTILWPYKYQLLRYFLLGRDRECTVNFSNHLQVNDLVGRQQVCHLTDRGGVSGNNDNHCCIFCFLSDLGGVDPKNLILGGSYFLNDPFLTLP